MGVGLPQHNPKKHFELLLGKVCSAGALSYRTRGGTQGAQGALTQSPGAAPRDRRLWSLWLLCALSLSVHSAGREQGVSCV